MEKETAGGLANLKMSPWPGAPHRATFPPRSKVYLQGIIWRPPSRDLSRVSLLGCPWKLVTIVRKLVYNPVTKYHGHPSSQSCYAELVLEMVNLLREVVAPTCKPSKFGTDWCFDHLPGDSSRDLLILQLGGHQQPLKGSLNHPKQVTSRSSKWSGRSFFFEGKNRVPTKSST